MSRTHIVEGEMTVSRMALQREKLLEVLAEHGRDTDGGRGGPLVLELAAVDLIDSAGLQLLLALRRSLAQRASTLLLAGVPSVVLEAIDLYGLRGLLLAKGAS